MCAKLLIAESAIKTRHSLYFVTRGGHADLQRGAFSSHARFLEILQLIMKCSFVAQHISHLVCHQEHGEMMQISIENMENTFTLSLELISVDAPEHIAGAIKHFLRTIGIM